MPRIIRIERSEPFEICPRRRSVWICGCGLSQNKPFCDGSHTSARKESPDNLCIYNELTQQLAASIKDPGSLTSLVSQGKCCPQSNTSFSIAKEIWTNKQSSNRIVRFDCSSPLFQSVIDVRRSIAQNGSEVTDEFDRSSVLYLMEENCKPVATMRVNLARQGLLDCEEFFPETCRKFILDFRVVVSSASRFVRHFESGSDPAQMRQFIRQIWRDQYNNGIRIDLINVHERMIPYYKRLGYLLIRDSFFRHPRLDTPSYVMCLLADKRERSVASEVLSDWERNDFLFDLVRERIDSTSIPAI